MKGGRTIFSQVMDFLPLMEFRRCVERYRGVSLRSFRLQVIPALVCALRGRSQKSRMTWPRPVAIAERWLPNLTSFHRYPNLRFDARHPR
jgi:hypothetical protein